MFIWFVAYKVNAKQIIDRPPDRINEINISNTFVQMLNVKYVNKVIGMIIPIFIAKDFKDEVDR